MNRRWRIVEVATWHTCISANIIRNRLVCIIVIGVILIWSFIDFILGIISLIGVLLVVDIMRGLDILRFIVAWIAHYHRSFLIALSLHFIWILVLTLCYISILILLVYGWLIIRIAPLRYVQVRVDILILHLIRLLPLVYWSFWFLRQHLLHGGESDCLFRSLGQMLLLLLKYILRQYVFYIQLSSFLAIVMQFNRLFVIARCYFSNINGSFANNVVLSQPIAILYLYNDPIIS